MSTDNQDEKDSSNFKNCTTCSNAWPTRIEFLEDQKTRIIGYQPSFKNFAQGYIFFLCPCDTTLGLRIKEFDDLYDGPRFVQILTGTEKCSGHCLDKKNLEDCNAECAGSYVRKILQIIKTWPREKYKEIL